MLSNPIANPNTWQAWLWIGVEIYWIRIRHLREKKSSGSVYHENISRTNRLIINEPFNPWGDGALNAPLLWFFTLYFKIFRQLIPEYSFPNFLLRMPLWKKNSFTPSAHFGTVQYNNNNIFFPFIKKIFLQTIVQIIFRF